MTAPHPSTSRDDTPRKTDLTVTHVAAAALAAVTTAVLGAGLGAAGTLIGAAGASVITTVGTAVYQASLERSREKVRSLAQRTRSLPPTQEASLNHEQLADSLDRGPKSRGYSRRFAMLRWGAVVAGALGAFLLAMMVITGFEWASGETIGGNGKGTTIGQVVTDQSNPRKPAIFPVPHGPSAPTSETPSGTPTETTTAPTTTTTTPDGGGVKPSPTKTSDRPAPSEVTPTPSPLIPTRLPGVGG
jgi:hypothetical protein